MTRQLGLIVIIGVLFGGATILLKIALPLFRRLKFGQMVRTEGPSMHLGKGGTPTLGGILIIISTILINLVLNLLNPNGSYFTSIESLLLIIPFVGYGIIGLIDDLLIILKKKNEGLKPKMKFLLEIIMAGLYYFILLGFQFRNQLNFFGIKVPLGFGYGVFLLIMFSGMTNATNFTDGVDGLLSLTSLTSFIAIGIIAYLKDNNAVAIMCIAICLSLIAFLVFNLPKAQIFMGDTGSLALGALMCSMCVLLKCELLIVIIGLVYVIELCSVMLQVWFFKRTKGQRLIKMAPLHHHFEYRGYTEGEIDLLFFGISLIFAILGIYLGVLVF